jgi:hypothetical protein
MPAIKRSLSASQSLEFRAPQPCGKQGFDQHDHLDPASRCTVTARSKKDQKAPCSRRMSSSASVDSKGTPLCVVRWSHSSLASILHEKAAELARKQTAETPWHS